MVEIFSYFSYHFLGSVWDTRSEPTIYVGLICLISITVYIMKLPQMTQQQHFNKQSDNEAWALGD